MTPQQVYMAKAAMGKQASNGTSPHSAILAAKQLVDKLGSVEKAKDALNVLATLV